MTALRAYGFALVATLSLLGCTGETADLPPDVSMRMFWLNGSATEALPPSVVSLFLRIDFAEGDPDSAEPAILDEDGDGRLEAIQRGLPTDTPIRVVVRGLDEARVTRFVGAVGPIVLRPGERRLIDIYLYEVGRATRILSTQSMGFMHTATNLGDGRVLIAGGFDEPTPTTCPGDTNATECFSVTATNRATLFEIATGRTYPVDGGMLAARGGHTATLLPGGRVLVAGGATHAIIGFEPDGDGGRIPVFVPTDNTGATAAHDTFEVFDPNLHQEGDDVEANGDPGRGGFAGSASEMPNRTRAPGIMNRQRFMHAASIVPGTDGSQVILVGGLGTNGGSRSWEIYDDRKPGGHGFYEAIGNRFPFEFDTPSAVTVTVPSPGRVWVFGGRYAASNDELALIWRPDTMEGDPNGFMEPGATNSAFPNTGAAAELPHPEYGLIRPAVAPIGGNAHALAVGWFGPRCDAGGTPFFPSTPGERLCEAPMEGATAGGRSFTVNGGASGEPGTTQVTPTASTTPPAFAASVTLDDGSVVIAGGIASKDWSTTHTVPEWFTGSLDASGAALLRPDDIPLLLDGRIFHQLTALPDVGYLVTGGITFDPVEGSLNLVSGAEVVYPFADRSAEL